MHSDKDSSRKILNLDSRELASDFSLPSRDGKRDKKRGGEKKVGNKNESKKGNRTGNPLRQKESNAIEIDAELPTKRMNSTERKEREDSPKKPNNRKSGGSNILERRVSSCLVRILLSH
jgi:hypothetical protein